LQPPRRGGWATRAIRAVLHRRGGRRAIPGDANPREDIPMKVILWIVGIIFVIGLLVVLGIGGLIF
jgi:hypothetical protein